jgi:hypothetical protein
LKKQRTIKSLLLVINYNKSQNKLARFRPEEVVQFDRNIHRNKKAAVIPQLTNQPGGLPKIFWMANISSFWVSDVLGIEYCLLTHCKC